MVWLEVAGLDVDGVTEFRRGVDLAGLDDFFEGVVFGDLPMNLDRSLGHAAAGFEGLGREAGPEDDAFVIGVTGRDAEAEGIAGEYVRRSCGSVAA